MPGVPAPEARATGGGLPRALPAAALLCLSFVSAADPAATGVPALHDAQDDASLARVLAECRRQPGESRDLLPRPSFPDGAGSAADLAALIDGVLCAQFAETAMAGAAVAVVDRGRVAFSSGYFHADRDAATPVDPARTMFRIGSISKLFTWTAAMQLVEAGRLGLDADLNEYLERFEIPASFAQPVTLKNLMTHTSGFEENIAGIGMARRWEDLPTLEDTIEEHVPARVRPPATDFRRGELAAYSNWGAALAGYIVAQRSGEAFDDYVERHIFQPLQMRHSSFREAATPDPAISRGYYRGEAQQPLPCEFEYMHGLGPSGSGSVSAGDMARFMIAHLQDGRFGDGTILRPETARLMHSQALSIHPDLAGAAHGFKERHLNGRRLLWHDGLTRCFYSELYLLRDEEIGLFVAYNTHPKQRHAGELMQVFMDRYFPAARPVPPDPPAPGDHGRLAPYAGDYQATSRAQASWEKVLTLANPIRVGVTEQGALKAPRSPGSRRHAEWILVPGTPGLLRRADGLESMALLETAHGDAYVIGPFPFAPMIRLRWYETRHFNGDVVALCVLGFVLAILLALGPARDPAWRPYRGAIRLAAVVGAVNLGILAALWLAWSDPGDITIALPRALWTAMSLSIASVVLALGLLLAIACGWRRPDWTPAARRGLVALALPDVAFLAWLGFWNLIGFQLG